MIQDTLPASTEEYRVERTLRPQCLHDYIGQTNVREQLEIFIQATTVRQEALDHVLIFGPPGLGKTTLAHIIATEMQAGFKHTAGPVLDKAGDLAAILTNLAPNDILFIDEIHRLNPTIEEILYPAMEDFKLDIILGEGPVAKSIRLNLPPFTLVGATTRAGLLTSPLRDRFGIIHHLEFYNEADLTQIIQRSARLLKIELIEDAAKQIACRSRGTPRIANRLLRRVRDFAQVKGNGVITLPLAKQALDLLNVDSLGFDALDRKLLYSLVDKFEGGPVGIESLAAALNEERETLEDLIEPYLIQEGFLLRTPRGRMATGKTYAHFGLKKPPRNDVARAEKSL